MTELTFEYLDVEYNQKERSFADIAKELGTYPNKVRREAIKAGINPRDKSVAQALALKHGRIKHPTAGCKREESVKNKIADGVSSSWKNLTEEEYQGRVDQAKEQWKNMSKEERSALMKAAGDAVRKASVEGSKLENFVLNKLRSLDYVVQFHRKGLLMNERLEVDIFLPELKTVIEIDGPAHFLPIWGEENLARNLKADAQKTGLLITKGFAIIRVKHLSKHVSKKQMRDIADKIVETVEKIEKKFPTKNQRLIQIEV